jgi:threonine efflux protein
MNEVAALAALAAIHISWNLGVGPNVVLVAHVAMRHSRREAVYVATGLAIGASLWAILAALGFGALSAIGWLQDVARMIGAAYLIYVGATMLVKAKSAEVAPALESFPSHALLRRGILANLTNPISLVFFTSVFAAVLPPDSAPWVRLAAPVVIGLDAVCWYMLLAVMFSSTPARSRYLRAAKWLDRFAGAAMIGFGLRLLFTRRSTA